MSAVVVWLGEPIRMDEVHDISTILKAVSKQVRQGIARYVLVPTNSEKEISVPILGTQNLFTLKTKKSGFGAILSQHRPSFRLNFDVGKDTGRLSIGVSDIKIDPGRVVSLSSEDGTGVGVVIIVDSPKTSVAIILKQIVARNN